MSSCETWVCTLVVDFHEFALHFADDEIVSWLRWFSRCERDSDARGHWSVPFENGSQTTAGDSELTEGQGDWDGQEGELIAPLCSTAGRRFRKLVRNHELSPDILCRWCWWTRREG